MNLKKKQMENQKPKRYVAIKDNWPIFEKRDVLTLVTPGVYSGSSCHSGNFSIENPIEYLAEMPPDGYDEVAELKARVAELEAQLANQPKPDWWRQYKVGDKIDLIGLKIAGFNDKEETFCLMAEDFALHSFSLNWTDDRHIRPHKPE